METKVDEKVVDVVYKGATKVFSEGKERPQKCCTCKILKLCSQCDSTNKSKGDCGHWYCGKCWTQKDPRFGKCPCRHDNNEVGHKDHYTKPDKKTDQPSLEDFYKVLIALIEKVKGEIEKKK